MQHATYFVVLFTIELIESRLIGVAGVIVEQTAYDSNEAFCFIYSVRNTDYLETSPLYTVMIMIKVLLLPTFPIKTHIRVNLSFFAMSLFL